MNYRFSSQLDFNEYKEFANKQELYNLYQSEDWPKVKKEWEYSFTGLYQDEKLVGVGLVLFRQLALGFTLAYLPRGPLFDFSDYETLNFYFNNLKKFCKKKKAIMIRIDPNILLSSVKYKDINEHEPIRNHQVINQLTKLGFQHYGFNLDMYATSQPRFSAVYYYYPNCLLETTKAQKSIKKALGKGVEVERIYDDNLALFSELMSYTEKRKNVSLRNQEYYQRLYDAYRDDIYLYVTKVDVKKQVEIKKQKAAELANSVVNSNKNSQKKDQYNSLLRDIENEEELLKEGKDIIYISCLLAIKVKDTMELLYAGMNEKYNKYLATYVSYFEGIKQGYELGCKKCDFGGIEGTLDDGLTIFKSYFNPNIDEYIGEFDLPLNKLLYFGFTKGLPIFKKIRRYFRGKKK